MIVSELLTWIEIGISIGGFLIMIGYYKATFAHHEKILDRHEAAINAIVNRLEAMNCEISFLKGLVFNK